MKKFTIASVIIFLSQQCYSNEWVAFGEQPKLLEAEALEISLWNYLEKESKAKFEPKETYRFQYKYINKSSIYINALCRPVRQKKSQPWFDGPTSEELRENFFHVKHGGSCFFNVVYDVRKAKFNSLYVSLEE